jgi:GPH family glycoside/pentoside/hexuronide:cation symporter
MLPEPSKDDTAIAAGQKKTPQLVKLAYGLGGAVQNGGFDTAIGFSFFYYSAVLGLSPSLVGIALAVGLVCDALVDPFIGSWSDNLKSRLGRRLPPMIAAVPLVAVSMGLLFSPPQGLSELALLGWLTVMTVSARGAMSLFNVPFLTLGAELETGYASRTGLVMYRVITGLIVSVAITAVGYSVYFADGGLLKPASYPGFGWSVAGFLFVSMTFCCLGLQKFAAGLPQPEPSPSPMWKRLPGGIVEIFRNRSFRFLFIAAVLFYGALGVNASLNSYSFIFVWRMKSETIQFVTYAFLAGTLLGGMVAPMLQKLIEKKNVVLVGFGLLIANWLVLQGLQLAGLYLPLGDDAVLPMQINSFTAGVGIGFVSVVYPSMMADAADEHELLFKNRREGLYFAGLGLANNAGRSIGVMMAGFALDLISFPKGLSPDDVAVLPGSAQSQLVLIWGPLPAIVAITSMVVFARYRITRARHRDISIALGRVS